MAFQLFVGFSKSDQGVSFDDGVFRLALSDEVSLIDDLDGVLTRRSR